VDFQCVAENLRESFRVIASSRAQGELREYNGVSIASAGVEFQMFNAAFLSAPVESERELEVRITTPAVHFQARGLDWAYWVCDDLLSPSLRRHSRAIFERHGLRHSVGLPCMLADAMSPPLKPLPRIDVRRVSNGPAKDAFCAIGSTCFNVPINWFREVFDAESVWERFAAYVAYMDGEPVSTAAVVMGGGAAGVYNVATSPDRRRQGLGEAVMRWALDDVGPALPSGRTVLQSTAAGFRLYERMGFRTVGQVSVYSSWVR
jgi:ribosomal protein S18 acetylase RimI-like enzyme